MDTETTNLERLKFEFQVKTKIKFGTDEFKNLGKYLSELDFNKIGIVIDKNVYKYVKDDLDSLQQKTKILHYDYGEPTYEILEEKRNFFPCTYDCIIGVGGGSVIDFTKGLAFLATNLKPDIEYRGFPKDVNEPIPIIAVPTTAGTGSEVTYNAVFIDENKKKLGINTPLNFPTLAILDPKLVQSCPKSVMISSGLDTLTHVVESFGAKQSNYLTRLLSYKAMIISLNNLEKAVKTKKLFYISNMMLASYMAGIALMNSGSGPAGALSYILGPQFNIPHGLASGVFLPHIVKHNESKGFNYFDYNHWRAEYPELYPMLVELYDSLGVDFNDIRKYNVLKAKDLRLLSQGIETLQPAFNQNPVKFTIEDAKNIIREMVK